MAKLNAHLPQHTPKQIEAVEWFRSILPRLLELFDRCGLLLNAVFHKAEFYDPETRNLVAAAYAEEIELFGYTFFGPARRTYPAGPKSAHAG
ncbi:MAG TPA: hypothetical protein VFE34_22690 [Dongiaceae bacterium]|jgi:hypothetical protein|nr:hypothetical protein [Dongiaceae bacterium]